MLYVSFRLGCECLRARRLSCRASTHSSNVTLSEIANMLEMSTATTTTKLQGYTHTVTDTHMQALLGVHFAVIDYANHRFLRCTFRNLRRMGLNVGFAFNSSFQSPGNIADESIAAGEVPIGVNGEFRKYSYFHRIRQDIEWARRCVSWLEQDRPMVVLCANAPLEVQRRIARWCEHRGSKFVFWLQDIHGIAMGRFVGRKSRILG